MMSIKVLLVEDDRSLREALGEVTSTCRAWTVISC